ncbi:MAG: hypothetical protein JNJ45_02550 [Chthonomonas sp.]|nr:hypothetical protein [Chthonomonas sp.]
MTIRVPGRVNLMGDHVDYHDGIVVPCAINAFITVRAELDDGPWTTSASVGEQWQCLPRGVIELLGEVPPFAAHVESTLPVGAGLSSSAAIAVAFAHLGANFQGQPINRLTLAKLAQRAEHEYAGVMCGLMDQLAVSYGQAGRALRIDLQTETITPIPIPEAWTIALIPTGVTHELASTEYGQRRAATMATAQRLGLTTLRNSTADQVKSDPLATHVVDEIARAEAFCAALLNADETVAGALMRASHESLDQLYRVSCPELNAAAARAWAAPGCIGARMTGGGFGGSVVALVHQNRKAAFHRAVPEARFVEPVDGARFVSEPG